MRWPLRRRPRDRTDAPGPEELDARHRIERRAVARRLHPDRGGDVEQYLAALAAVDRRYGRSERSAPAHPAARRRPGVRRRLTRAARSARTRLPRGAPGARRYARL